MKKALLSILGIAFLLLMAADVSALPNSNAKWVLHNAGAHNAKTNTCGFVMTDCSTANTYGGSGGERNDIYVLAIDITEITATRYGLCCDGSFYFYGWTSCADLELPTAGWPACGEGNAQTFGVPVYGPHVTMGILDVYIYAGSLCLSICPDPRTGFGEFCDGTEPNPICFATADPVYFGAMEFNGGSCAYNPCNAVPVEKSSWGALKAIYR